MNIPKFNIPAYLKRNVRKRRDVFSPARDWFMLLSLSAVVYVLAIGYGLWTYWRIQDAGTSTQPIATADATMRAYTQDLDAALMSAQSNKATFEFLKTALVPPDPSI